MLPTTLNFRSSHRRERIEWEIFRPRGFLRRGSVPKWCNPKLSSRSVSSDDFDPESDNEARSLRSSAEASDRARILRKDSWFRTRSLNDLKRAPSPSQDRSEIRWTEEVATVDAELDVSNSNLRQLCEICQGINIETISGEDGYEHLLLQDIDVSKLTCRMCDFLQDQLDGKVDDFTEDRYRIRLSCEIDSIQWSDDHYTPSSSEEDYSVAMIEVMDLRPWEPPEYYKARFAYENSKNPESFLRPQGSQPVSVRGRPVYFLTKEHDPASEKGIRWIRDVGVNTASPKSIEIAKGWLSKCLSSGDAISGTRVLPHLQSRLQTRRQQAGSGPSTSSEPDVSSGLNASSKSNEFSKPDATPEPIAPFQPDVQWTPLRRTFPQEYPARLIRISEISSEKVSIHLINAQDRHYQYAALSYCWGVQGSEEGCKWQLTEANECPHHENIRMDVLPQTIRDSIMITWKLGVSYIWIDALCIVQDSASDWAQEAAKMASIYRGSLVTIAASASASAKEGCFNSTSQRTTELGKFRDVITVKGSLQNGQESCLYFLKSGPDVSDMYEEEILNAPLAKRAWTYQEYVLPRRVIYFTSKQLLWECMHCRLSEDNFPQTQSARPYPILDFDYVLGQDKIAAFWYIGAVQQYTQRQMTFEKDKLIAISALAKATFYNKQSDYIAGLWRDSLALGLAWCRSSDGHKSNTFPCPSWSWASQKSEVSYHIAAQALKRAKDHRLMSRDDSEDDDDDDEWLSWPASRIISVDWKTDQNNAFGNALDAHIDLYTFLGTGTVAPRSYNARIGYGNDCAQTILIPYTSKSGKAEWSHAVATLDDSGVLGAHVAIALLREPTNPEPVFLLLDPPDLNAKSFRRVGLAESVEQWHRHGESDDWIQVTKSWARKTIRLV